MTELQMKEGRVYVKDDDNLILCAHQEYARELIHEAGNGVDGIYPIPDLQWEVKEVKIRYSDWIDSKTVAILKESTPSTEQESQEELWKAVSNEINDEGLWLYDDYVGFTINAKGFAYLMKQFSITRKP